MSSDKAKEMAAELGIQYYETSAATGQGVEEAVEALLALVMARIERSLEEERRKVLSQESQHTRKLSMRSGRVASFGNIPPKSHEGHFGGKLEITFKADLKCPLSFIFRLPSRRRHEHMSTVNLYQHGQDHSDDKCAC